MKKKLTTPSKFINHSFWKTEERNATDVCTNTLNTHSCDLGAFHSPSLGKQPGRTCNWVFPQELKCICHSK